jgi:hypothetical protein
MKKVLSHTSFYIQQYPARITGYISAILLNAEIYFKGFPVSLLVPAAMLLIMFGEGSQRMEDRKTVEALYVENNPNKKDEDIIAEMLKKLHEKEHESNV